MEIWRLMIDFGLVILIWMTQIIVYPSFTYLNQPELARWHQKYTIKITFIVAPLMFAQVGIIVWQLIQNFHVLHMVSALLVISAWINTFFFAVPLHENITKNINESLSSKKLVRVNWFRTAVWSIVWMISLWQVLIK
ncbi:MAG: hypothetical protein R3345_12705 [Fulvivirga sp.]|nr:hypothetical protein [Fulvivirga sp.]